MTKTQYLSAKRVTEKNYSWSLLLLWRKIMQAKIVKFRQGIAKCCEPKLVKSLIN
ncbi:MAG: hypothetical protein RSD04_02055 [Clostridia bacterium]